MVIQINLGSPGGQGPAGPGRGPGRPSWALYLPGAALIVFGLLVLILPQILQFIVGGLCVLGGIGLLIAASRLGSLKP